MSQKEVIQSRDEMEKLLSEGTMGFLGLSMNGAPYVVPMTYGYDNGKILLHCRLEGKKLDYIRANPQVCFTIGRQSGNILRHPHGSQCKADHDSVICYGRARIIEDLIERLEVLNEFNRCLRAEAKELNPEEIVNCLAVEIKIDHMTGRRQRKGLEYMYFEYGFE